MNDISTAKTMTLDGGDPSLDFVNSGYDRLSGVVTERLHSYSDLILLSGRLGIIDEELTTSLLNEAKAHPDKAESALNKAKLLRNSIYEICKGKINLEPINSIKQSLEFFNGYLSDSLRYRKISVQKEEFKKDWFKDKKDLEYPLRRLTNYAYELITSPRQYLIKQCGGCAWLFVDDSKNHRRRWCDMSTCGNSAKVKRYYRKKVENK
jgi:predicted RNA-binding Zn ribbon-like protein